MTLRTNALSVSLATFLPKTAIHTETNCKNINATGPNTFSNSMMSCTSQYILVNYGKKKLIIPQKQKDKISPNQPNFSLEVPGHFRHQQNTIIEF